MSRAAARNHRWLRSCERCPAGSARAGPRRLRRSCPSRRDPPRSGRNARPHWARAARDPDAGRSARMAAVFRKALVPSHRPLRGSIKFVHLRRVKSNLFFRLPARSADPHFVVRELRDRGRAGVVITAGGNRIGGGNRHGRTLFESHFGNQGVRDAAKQKTLDDLFFHHAQGRLLRREAEDPAALQDGQGGRQRRAAPGLREPTGPRPRVRSSASSRCSR